MDINNVPEKVLDVYNIFKEFFGEDNVDLQYNEIYCVNRYAILIYFKEVTVTNENNLSTVVTDLFVKVNLTNAGCISNSFNMTRGSYTLEHLAKDYVHSHADYIHPANSFALCCLGQGPINNTISRLSIEYDSDVWNLFCFELMQYIQTESQYSGPYHYIRDLGYDISTSRTNIDYKITANYRNLPDELKQFFRCFIDDYKITTVHNDNIELIGMNPIECFNLINEAFKTYCKQTCLNIDELVSGGYIQFGSYNNRALVYKQSHTNLSERYANRVVCKFKGEEVKLKVLDRIVNNNEYNYVTLTPTTINSFLKQYFKIINYEHSNKFRENSIIL